MAFRPAVLLGFAAVLSAGTGLSHEWYDQRCCDDRDCAPLPGDASVTPVLGGYAVLIGPDRRVFFSRDKVKPSRDGQYHACLSPSGTPFCIYVPLGS